MKGNLLATILLFSIDTERICVHNLQPICFVQIEGCLQKHDALEDDLRYEECYDYALENNWWVKK